MVRGPEPILAPGAYDALSARMIEQAGFPAVYMTGFGTSASLLGRPDVGLLTMSQMVDNARRIAQAVEVPVIADADTGYGNPLNVIRTVQEYELAGVSAIHIEDQAMPKKCGHMENKQVIPIAEMTEKVRAAVEARRSNDFLISARTDARAAEGLDSPLRRARAYREAAAAGCNKSPTRRGEDKRLRFDAPAVIQPRYSPSRALDASRNAWRKTWQRAGEKPHQEENQYGIHHELKRGKPYQIARAYPQCSQNRKHPKRVDQIGQRFRRVVDLDYPAEMNMQIVGRLQNIRRLDDPFASARWDKQSQNRGVDGHQQRESSVRGNAHEEMSHVSRNGRHGHNAKNSAIKRELNEHARRGRDGIVHGASEGTRPPMQQQSGHEK